VRKDVVRLHILANSDSEKDQKVKLQVRDALLKENNRLLSSNISTENAHLFFEESKDELLDTARKVLKENGFNYGVRVYMEKEYCYKLGNLVNNLSGDSNKIVNDYHKMQYKDYCDSCRQVYKELEDLFVEMADENMGTITDLDNYISWILYDK
jgi:hypothetical protein